MSETIKYGIDLGTTNSAIAKCDGNEVKIFKNRDQMEITPSVVRIEKTGRIIVGRRAYQTLLSDPDNVASEFKRLMGQNDFKLFKAANRKLSPEELSAEVLKSLLDDVQRQTTETVNAAVITVPAAFGQLQCEATARAANLAGLSESPLLQEPLAASIAYGMKPDTRNKKWLVYDFGGGTFDIAVVSTKDGRLSVLEHRGDNMLGGKDFDRLIVEKIIWPHLAEAFNIGSLEENRGSYSKLFQILRIKAEEAKIDLSHSEQVVIGIFDCGEDKDGKPVELEINFSRSEMNHLIEPFISKSITMCKQALSEARVTPQDVSTIILVGGPTNMPFLREMLSKVLNIPLDFSLDPMTIVSRGAAIYASTQPLKIAPSKGIEIKQGAIELDLAYEPVWSETTCLVAGNFKNITKDTGPVEVRIDSESGHWTSGWIPVASGYFESKVHLLEGRTVKYWIYLRNSAGKVLDVTPDSFSIRHGITISEPPLPHSIGAEIVSQEGKNEIDVIFPRSTPLPAEKSKLYQASKTLKPSQTDDCLTIKIWEGESFSDPKANNWVGALKIGAREISRPIPEGTDIEIMISIDASRLMTVSAFIPVLNQHFQDRVYIPKENEETITEKAMDLNTELNEHYKRLQALEAATDQTNENVPTETIEAIKNRLNDLSEELSHLKNNKNIDPDQSKKMVQESKNLRMDLSDLEKKTLPKPSLLSLIKQIKAARLQTEDTVTRWGQTLEKKEFEFLCREIDRHTSREDTKSLEKVLSNIEGLKWRVLFTQDWFWKECFESLCGPDNAFTNVKEAQRLISKGKEAILSGDSDILKETVRLLWDLQPKNQVESEKEMALEAGIKRKLQ